MLHPQYRQFITCVLAPLILSSCALNDTQKGRTSYGNENITIDDKYLMDFEKSLIHMRRQEYDKAIPLLKRFIKNEKRIAAPFINLGIAYNKTGQIKKAEQSFISALRINIGHAVANNELGLLYRRSGRFEAAKATYQNALAKHPNYLPVRKNLGILCELYLHDLECALKHYQIYLEYDPDNDVIKNWVKDIKQRNRAN